MNDFSGIVVTGIREDKFNLNLIIEGFINKLPTYEQDLYSILESELGFKNRIEDYDIGYSFKGLESVSVY